MRSASFALMILASTAAAADLPAAIRTITDAPEYKHARWGILVVDSKTGQTLVSQNANTFFAPASVTKLYSCAAALIALGPDHRFKTPVYALGNVTGGELNGDLVLIAQGDLTFGGRTGRDGKTQFRNNDHIYTDGFSTSAELTDTNPVAAFDELARQVLKAGIRSVRGEVLVDDRLFETSEGSGSGPRVVSPMMANDNLIDLIIVPGKKAGESAKVTMRPDTAYLRTDFDVKTIDAKSGRKFKDNDGDIYSLRGEIPLDSKPVVRIVPVRSPKDFARTLFIEALRREGVQVAAPLVRHVAASELPAEKAYGGMEPVAVFTSAPLAEMIEVTLKVSHNLYASALPHLVAVKQKNGRSLAAGMRAQGVVLKDLGVDPGSISFGGGAGGDRADHVTPNATVALLRAMQKRPEWAHYKAALPVLGVDGTLANAVDTNSSAKGAAFGKTGTLMYDDSLNGRTYLVSKALAGVMTTKKGTELTFTLFVNDMQLPAGVRTSHIGKALGKLCEIVHENGP